MNKLYSVLLVFVFMFSVATSVSAGDLFNVGESWQKNWTKKEQAQYKLFLGLQAADVITTIIVLNGEGEELNPLYGRNPNAGKIVTIKAASNLAVWGLLNYIPKGKKGTILDVLNVVTGVVVINNGMVAMRVGF